MTVPIYYRLPLLDSGPDHDHPVPCQDVKEWGEWLGEMDRRGFDRTLCYDELPTGQVVLTRFHGMDENMKYRSTNGPPPEGKPVLWGTMVLSGRLKGTERRYTSARDAREGHNVLVNECLSSGERVLYVGPRLK